MVAMDKRQQKTRAALHGAFRELLLERGYEALTIGMVAQSASIGRSTFYEHYRTKSDLLRASINPPFRRLAGLADESADGGGLHALLRHFRDNQQVARVLLGWETRPVLISALAVLLSERLRARPPVQPLLPLDVIARQIAEAQLALIDAWIAGRPAMDIDAAAAALHLSTAALVNALLVKSTLR